jgi:hypothetical protein
MKDFIKLMGVSAALAILISGGCLLTSNVPEQPSNTLQLTISK